MGVSDYLTPVDHPSVVQALNVCKETFRQEPVIKSAKGMGDSHRFAETNSTIFDGKVPTLELGAAWHNAHTPGAQAGIGEGEWASRTEIVDIVRLIRALSKSIAEQTIRTQEVQK